MHHVRFAVESRGCCGCCCLKLGMTKGDAMARIQKRTLEKDVAMTRFTRQIHELRFF